jgi:hypothetical protein
MDTSGLIYYHHYIGNVRNPANRDYKNIPDTMAFVDDQDDCWSEYKNEQLYERRNMHNKKGRLWTWANTPMGKKAIGQSTKKFNFSMRLAKVKPGGELVASSQKLLDLIHTRYGLKGRKVQKHKFTKHKLGTALGVIKGRTFLYQPGPAGIRKRKPKATKQTTVAKVAAAVLKKFRRPLGMASASPKTASITLSAPAAKGGRSSTKSAFNNVSAGQHAQAHNAKLPAHVRPASDRRWEWLHLIGDAIGGPTSSANLAAGTFDSNSRHNAIEEAVVKESQNATPTNQLTYEVDATLINGTEIASAFKCRAKIPSLNGGNWHDWTPVDTLTVNKEDKAEDALLRHASTMK